MGSGTGEADSGAERDRLARAVAGVRGLLLDLDGVLVIRGKVLPGGPEALAELDRRGIPYRVMTNTSSVSREGLARFGEQAGLSIPPDRILSALSASSAYTARTYPGQPLYVLAPEEARGEFAGQWVLGHDEASRPDARAAAVVIGDSPDDLSYAVLNSAFRLVRGGAELIGMHKNRWWVTPDGPRLDSGAIVAGLEYAVGRRALILGKPAPAFFREGLRELRDEARGHGRSLARNAAVGMVGDDLWTDVLAAQRVGLRGFFVLSGKHGRDELAKAAARTRARAGARSGGRGVPDGVAPSLVEIVAALD
jgi:HAD superfamily hydrolase (TIGR01450 family)